MNKVVAKKSIMLTALLLIVAAISCVYIYVYQPFWLGNYRWPPSLSSPTYKDTGLFRINSGTIIAVLDDNTGVDIFLPDSRSLDDRYDGPVLYNEPASWTQADNLKIVSALNNFVWKDTVDDWSLFRMIFNVDCEDHFSGIPGGIFTYFKTVSEKGKILDLWREFEVNPGYEFVAWGGDAEYPHPLFGWKRIDLSRLKVMAEDAVRIAEENGGREERLSSRNQCSIHLSLVPEGFDGWEVDYSTGLEILIDPYSGEIIE